MQFIIIITYMDGTTDTETYTAQELADTNFLRMVAHGITVQSVTIERV